MERHSRVEGTFTCGSYSRVEEVFTCGSYSHVEGTFTCGGDIHVWRGHSRVGAIHVWRGHSCVNMWLTDGFLVTFFGRWWGAVRIHVSHVQLQYTVHCTRCTVHGDLTCGGWGNIHIHVYLQLPYMVYRTR